jgi:hypothetical protein
MTAVIPALVVAVVLVACVLTLGAAFFGSAR